MMIWSESDADMVEDGFNSMMTLSELHGLERTQFQSCGPTRESERGEVSIPCEPGNGELLVVQESPLAAYPCRRSVVVCGGQHIGCLSDSGSDVGGFDICEGASADVGEIAYAGQEEGVGLEGPRLFPRS